MEFIFATNNQGKINEIRQLSGNTVRIITLQEAGIDEELPEPYDSFEQNAWSKADYVFQKTGKNCWAEDSGLVVPALGGAPGVFSARYAGVPSDDYKNNEKLLQELNKQEDRQAWYQATICLIIQGTVYYFEGKCPGTISHEYKGDNGFGYDPLFIPKGYSKTFGELDATIKSKISHRAKAFNQLAQFLRKI